jgi:hypothetical protein
MGQNITYFCDAILKHTIMAKIKSVLMAILLSSFLFPMSAQPFGDEPLKQVSVRIIAGAPRPRDLSDPDFSVWYNSETLYCYFGSDRGIADIELTSQTTGVTYNYYANTSLPTFSTPLPETSGSFEIIISFADGDVYEGSFVL